MLYKLVSGIGSTPSQARADFNKEVGDQIRDGWMLYGDHSVFTTEYHGGGTEKIVYTQGMISITDEEAEYQEQRKRVELARGTL